MTRSPKTGVFPTIHPIESVSVQPFSVMTHWRIFQLRGPLGSRSRHLVGRARCSGCAACVASTICGKARRMLSRRVHWNERPRACLQLTFSPSEEITMTLPKERTCAWQASF